MSAAEPRELDRLIQGYLDDALSDDEARRLHELLKQSPERLDDFIRAVDLHGSLSSLRSELGRAVAPAKAETKPTRRSSRRITPAPRAGSWFAGLAAAAILAMLLLFAFSSGGSGEADRLRAQANKARRGALEQERAAAEQDARRARARLGEIEEKLARPDLSQPRTDAPEAPQKDVARLQAEKEQIERDLREAVLKDRQAREELARIPEPQTESKDAPAPAPTRAAPTTSISAGVAVLEKVEGDVAIVAASEKVPAKGGESLRAGCGLEVSSGAVLVFPDGTRVEVGANTVLRDLKSDGGKRFLVVRGEVRAVVAKQPKDQPMVLTSLHAEAKVVGTTLRLVVDDGPRGFTRLEVLEGKVQLIQMPERKTVDVFSGYYAVAGIGAELVARPIPPNDIVLAPLQGRIVGKDWKIVRDSKAPTGQVLESIEIGSDTSQGRLKGGTMGYVEWTFNAESGRDYFIWIRGMSAAPSQPDYHDAAVVEVLECKVAEAPGPYKGSQGPQRAFINGFGRHPGTFCWLGGDGDDNREGQGAVLRFAQYGKQTLRMYPCEGPLRIESIWISLHQKSRPEDGQLGPPKPRK